MISNIKQNNGQTIDEAVQLLLNGGLVIVPTETVYGIVASALNDASIEQIFDIKVRPDNNPIQIMVKNLHDAQKLGEFNDTALKLADNFWPGAMTLVVKRKNDSTISLKAFCGRDTIGIRIPRHPIMQALLRKTNIPLAISSANISGNEPCTNAHDASLEICTPIDLIIDGGESQIGFSSTVIDCTGDKPIILREGGITQEMIDAAI